MILNRSECLKDDKQRIIALVFILFLVSVSLDAYAQEEKTNDENLSKKELKQQRKEK